MSYDMVVNRLREQVKKAEEKIAELEKLIQLGEKAGEDMMQYRYQLDALKERLKLWKEALKVT